MAHVQLMLQIDEKLTLEVEEVAFTAADGLALTDNDGRHDLLSELGLTLLDRGEEEIADGASRVPVETSTSHGASDHVEILGSSVVSAVHD